jgi:heat shock protein HslJ
MSRNLRLACAPLLLAGCATMQPGAPDLAGTQWRFTAIDGAAPVSNRARLEFERDRLGANVGCNGMGGEWRIENGRLIAGQLVQTQMYCEGAVWGQERAVSALLQGSPAIAIVNGRMTLRGSGHSAELRRAY